MRDLLEGLNPQQVLAVTTTEGPVLVLAGAGSGKTKALVHRIAYLVEVKKVSPHNLLAITFTNKAGEEMATRVEHLLGKSVKGSFQISTFHSFCARLLRVEAGKLGFAQNFSILAADDQLTLVKQLMEELSVDPKRTYPEAIRSNISMAKNELVDAAEYSRLATGAFQQTVARVYSRYQEALKQNQAMDFDDLLTRVVELFRTHPEVLAKYQERFVYILVDEYQDTNAAQYEIVRMLADRNRNLFVVGDDWQSIYSWRGANYQNILNFHRDYADVSIIKLEQNYRSTQNILDAAHSVIMHNQNRSDKKLWTDQTEGEVITVCETSNDRAEGDFILREISRLQIEHDAKLNEIAILYRTNAQSRGLEEALLSANVPYRVVGGVRFYDRKEIRDMIAFLTLIANPDNKLALERVINLPARGIGKKTLSDLATAAAAKGLSVLTFVLEAETLPPAILEFKNIFTSIKKQSAKLPLSKLLDFILTATRYKQMLADEGIEGETRLENIYELKSVMERHDHQMAEGALTDFLEEVSLIADIDNYQAAEAAVTLMTMHSAKGLEFDFVFIAGAEEGIFPHSRSLFDANELEEERRLCYVAITRARKKVYFLHARERLLYGGLQNNPPSRFIGDLPEDLIEYLDSRSSTHVGPARVVTQTISGLTPGTKVIHKQFGGGTIISRSGDILTVAFTSAGIKQLAAELADLKTTK